MNTNQYVKIDYIGFGNDKTPGEHHGSMTLRMGSFGLIEDTTSDRTLYVLFMLGSREYPVIISKETYDKLQSYIGADHI